MCIRDSYNPSCFHWVDLGGNHDAVFAFAREDYEGGQIIAVLNFSAYFYKDLKLPMEGAEFEELINTDAQKFGGSGIVNREMKLQLQLAPFSGCLIKKICKRQ